MKEKRRRIIDELADIDVFTQKEIQHLMLMFLVTRPAKKDEIFEVVEQLTAIRLQSHMIDLVLQGKVYLDFKDKEVVFVARNDRN